MNKNELKFIAERLIDTFNLAGKESMRLYDEGLNIEIKKDFREVPRMIKCQKL